MDLRLIGRIADGATDTSATAVLLKDMESEVSSESLVLIENGGEGGKIGKVVGVLRRGLGRNELLNLSRYRPDIAYMKYGGEPSSSREVFSFQISLIGEVEEREGAIRIRPNRKIIAPRSPVYLFDDDENPLERYIAPSAKQLEWLDAHLDGHPTWRVPADKFYVPYHVGVFGATGTGKSWFTRYVLIPFYIRCGLRVLVLDWSGSDYVPYYEDVVPISEVAQDEISILKYLSGITDKFAGNASMQDVFDQLVCSWHDLLNRVHTCDELYEEIQRYIRQYIDQVDKRWRSNAERASDRIFRKLKPITSARSWEQEESPLC